MNILNKSPVVSKDIFMKIDDNKVLLIDSERANWVVVSHSLAEIVLTCDGGKSIANIIDELNMKSNIEFCEKLLFCFTNYIVLIFSMIMIGI